MASATSASQQGMASAMAGVPKRKVWIRGAGLNSETQPTRAFEFLGPDFENARVQVTVDRMRPGGSLYVIMEGGYKFWVHPKWVTHPDPEVQELENDVVQGGEGDAELGSDVEAEDVAPEAEGEEEGSGTLRERAARAQGWVPCTVHKDQRTKEGYLTTQKGCIKGIDGVDRDLPWTYFWRMMPVAELDAGIAIMQEKGKQLWPTFTLSRDLFLKWLGVWFRMCADKHKSQEEHWDALVEEPYGEVMGWDTFRKIKRVLTFPVYEETAEEKVSDMGEGPDSMGWIRRWIHARNKQWQAAWEPSTYLTVDETMIFWTGTGTAHLTYIPRKPSPLGIMLKTTCCGVSGVMVHMELVEGATVDSKKWGHNKFKATTACTLRLVRPWWGTGRVVIGDAWFGSLRTVEELREVGLYSIMCVKQGSAGYPKQVLRECMRERGEQRFFVAYTTFTDGGVLPVWAGGHMDKQPLMLCASTGTSLPGPKKVRYRSKLHAGSIVRTRYELEQPSMHATYRAYAPAVDQFNKLALQPGTLTDIWQTKDTFVRMWAATLSFIESNAQLAYHQGNTQGLHMTKGQWYKALAHSCIQNPFSLVVSRGVGLAPGHACMPKVQAGEVLGV